MELVIMLQQKIWALVSMKILEQYPKGFQLMGGTQYVLRA